jgi:TRAP-type C4-dicarboxylate transport system substrate-binding protein
VQSHINLTGHILDNLTTTISSGLWNKLTPQEREIFDSVYKQAAERAGASSRLDHQDQEGDRLQAAK